MPFREPVLNKLGIKRSTQEPNKAHIKNDCQGMLILVDRVDLLEWLSQQVEVLVVGSHFRKHPQGRRQVGGLHADC